jgi:hypothetical protein
MQMENDNTHPTYEDLEVTWKGRTGRFGMMSISSPSGSAITKTLEAEGNSGLVPADGNAGLVPPSLSRSKSFGMQVS